MSARDGNAVFAGPDVNSGGHGHPDGIGGANPYFFAKRLFQTYGLTPNKNQQLQPSASNLPPYSTSAIGGI